VLNTRLHNPENARHIVQTGTENDTWAGRYAYIYPELKDDWWVMVIEPSPTPGIPGNNYIDDGSYLEELAREGQFEWVPPGVEEERLEREHFGWRPLLSDEALARKRRSLMQRFHSWIRGR